MDGTRFDALITGLSRTRLTRWGVLRGLAASAAAAVIGVTLVADETGAKKGSGHKQGGNGGRHLRAKKAKQTICHCGNGDPASCSTTKTKRKSAKKHLKHQCDYTGPCQAGKSGCAQTACPDCPSPPAPPAVQCTEDADCVAGIPYCRSGVCQQTPGGQPCTDDTQCSSGACTCGINPVHGVCQANYVDGFEPTDPKTWENVTIVPSGTGGIPAHAGQFFAQVALANLSRTVTSYSYLGGYSAVFPPNGFDVQLAIYLDPGAAAGNWFEYTAAISGADCDHLRDFVFTAGKKVGPDFCVRVSNNAGDSDDPCTLPRVVLTGGPGWYIFRHEFRNVAGVLVVTFVLIDPNGSPTTVGTLSDPGDLIPSVVGGNRYAWFPVQHWPNLPIDDSSRTSL